MKVSEADIRFFRRIEKLYVISIEELREQIATHGVEPGVEVPESLVSHTSQPCTVGAAFRQQASQALADGKSGSLVIITLKAVRAAVSSGIARVFERLGRTPPAALILAISSFTSAE